MKKLIATLICVFCSFSVYAQNEGTDDSVPYGGAADLQAAAAEAAESAGDENPAAEAGGDEPEAELSAAETEPEDANIEKRRRRAAFFRGAGAALSTGKRDSRRYFELGLLDLNLGLGGIDVVKFFEGDFFDFGSLDVEHISGFTGDIRLFTNPVYFKVSIKDTFTLDFFTGAQMNIYLDLPQKTFDTLNNIMKKANEKPPSYTGTDEPSPADIADYEEQLKDYIDSLTGDATMTVGAGAFLELGVGGSKTLFNDRLWVRAAPSLFFTLLHMKNNDISLTGYKDEVNKKYGLKGFGSMKLYSAWDLDEDVNPFASPGVDLTLEARYALWSVLDIGLSVSHIPIVPSTLSHSTTIEAEKISMTVDGDLGKIINDPNSAVDFNIPDTDSLLKNSESESEKVIRPVRFDFYALYKPFKSPVLVLWPNIGATVNSAAGAGLFNWGITVEYNAPIIFSIYIGTGLTEGLWANRLGIALDFRVFEVDLGAALVGADFVGSFSPKNGIMAAVGFKFGF